jgi:hypothetical protein
VCELTSSHTLHSTHPRPYSIHTHALCTTLQVPDDLEEIKISFKAYDDNRDGKLSKEEMFNVSRAMTLHVSTHIKSSCPWCAFACGTCVCCVRHFGGICSGLDQGRFSVAQCLH